MIATPIVQRGAFASTATTGEDASIHENFARVVADLHGATTYHYGTGSVFAWMPGLGGHHVSDLAVVRVQRLDRSESVWRLLGREATLYTAPGGLTRIDAWFNPFTGKEVEVVHGRNDPVNVVFSDPPQSWAVGDSVSFSHNSLTLGEAPMRVDDYPLHSQDDILKLAELRTYTTTRSALRARGASVPMVGAETTASPWLPWMNMGQRRGWLITHLRFRKLTSQSQLPHEFLRQWPQLDEGFFLPPQKSSVTNETSWTGFKARIDAPGGRSDRSASEALQPVAANLRPIRRPRQIFDPADPDGLLRAFVKVEGDAAGRQEHTYSYANVYTLFDQRRDRHLFDRELLTSRRFVPTEGGWIRLHREVAIYRDPKTKRILERFHNPYLQREVDVIDIHRDFNRRYLVADVGKALDIGVMEAEQDVFFYRRFFVSRIAELQPRDYPLHGSDERYELAESHNYFVARNHVLDESLTSVPMRGVTTSISNWLPWMEMGTAPGKLIHQIRFAKLETLDDIPNADFVPTITRKYPEHLRAPDRFDEADAGNTGMGWYKAIIDAKK
jgi:hypothetical protein